MPRSLPADDRAACAALLVGATGLVGRELLRQLLPDDRYAVVHVMSRRPLAQPDAAAKRLQVHVGPLAGITEVPRVDHVYIALGTTIKVAGSQQAFREVDHDLVVHVARLAHRAGARRLAAVTALGADARSHVFYNRVKGETEDDLRGLGYATLTIVRPSLLMGDRAALKQADRPGEGLALRLLGPVSGWLPASIRPVPASAVAQAMRESLCEGRDGVRVIESRELALAAGRAQRRGDH